MASFFERLMAEDDPDPLRRDGREPARAAALRRSTPSSIRPLAGRRRRGRASKRRRRDRDGHACDDARGPSETPVRGRRRCAAAADEAADPSRRPRRSGRRDADQPPPSAAEAEVRADRQHRNDLATSKILASRARPDADFAAAEAEAAAFERRRSTPAPTKRSRPSPTTRSPPVSPASSRRRAQATSRRRRRPASWCVGLVSVASIASFKRQLGRVAGVQSVGVSSGPDGEFVFAVAPRPRRRPARRRSPTLPGLRCPRHRRDRRGPPGHRPRP